MMKKIVVSITLCLLLFACGNKEDGKVINETPTLSEISGVWDASVPYNGSPDDEMYLVVKSDGSYIIYDYFGDAFDNGDDCYFKHKGTITDNGNGDFKVVFVPEYGGEPYISEFHFEISDGNLILVQDGGNLTAFPSPLNEDDFVPLCDRYLNARILSQVSEECYCCPGFYIEIGGEIEFVDGLPENEAVDQAVADEAFPIDVRVLPVPYEGECPGRTITVSEIELF